MKTKVFLFLMLSTIICWGQIPTDDVMRYRFINNSLVNEASPGVGDLVRSGSSATFTNGVEQIQNSGLDVNTDSFVGGRTGSGALLSSFSFSFWIKLDNTEDSSGRIICSIDAPGSVNYEFLTQVVNENDPDVFFTWRTFGNGATGRQSILPLNDGEWHHIVFVRRQFSASGSMFSGYLDGVLSTLIAISSDNVGAAFNRLDNPALTISPSNEYSREIDNIRFYERALTQTEVTALYEEGDIVPFSDANFKSWFINNSSINTNNDNEIQISEALAYTGAVSVSNLNISDIGGIERFINITSIDVSDNQITSADFSANTNLTAINVSNNNLTDFNVKNGNNRIITTFDSTGNSNLSCVLVDDFNFSNTNWVLKDMTTNFSTTCNSVVYVNTNASGANDGTSWADAYTDLSTALSSGTNSVFWIAQGTYKTNLTQSSSFIIEENQNLYGGFNGTEIDISQRDVLVNPVVLSGDIGGDDANAALDFSNTSLQANNERLVWVEGDNVIIDGLTISGGFADSATDANRRSGSALYLSESSNNVTVNNVVFERNIAINGGTVYFNQLQTQTGSFNYTFTNCTFRNNLANHSVVMYAANPRNTDGAITTTKFINCLIYNNTIEDTNSSKGVNNLFWFRSDVAGGVNTGEIINSTIVNNVFNGTSTNAAGIIGASRTSGDTRIRVYNSIFNRNFEANSTSVEKKVVNVWTGQSSVNNIIVRNTLDPDNFSNVSNKLNVITADPLFTDVNTNNFTLQSSSPAIDTGDNSFVTTTEDILGNIRVLNTNVDLGAFEYDSGILIRRTLTTTASNGTIVADVAPTNGTYTDGTVVELTATPATGYQFDGWSGDANGTTNPLSVTMDADKSITALFSQIERTLTLNSSTGAIQTSGIPNSVSGNSQNHNDGTVVELTALPDTNYQFDGWSGDASGTDNPLSVTMDADKTITAMFSLVQQTLTTTAANGTIGVDIAPTNGTYDIGTVVELTATPDVGYQFDGWSGDASGTDNPLSVTINADKNITALFSPIQRKLTRTEINGFISVNIPATNEIYDNGTVIALTATPAIGYQFDGWSGDASGTDNPLSVTMDADKNITALFSLIPIQRTLTLAIPRIGGTVTRDISPINGTYEDGTVVELTATPAIGYQFDGWSGDASGTDTPLSVTMDADKNITALFSLIPIQRTLTIQLPDGPSGGVAPGTVTRDVNPINGTYDDGTIVMLTAVPGVGYQFDGWSGDASGTNNPLSVTMDADKTIRPVFSLMATASIVDESFNNEIRVYPNPVINSLTINLASGQELKKAQVFNLLGKKVMESTNNILDFSVFTSGIYILKLENSKGKIATRKIVKK